MAATVKSFSSSEASFQQVAADLRIKNFGLNGDLSSEITNMNITMRSQNIIRLKRMYLPPIFQKIRNQNKPGRQLFEKKNGKN